MNVAGLTVMCYNPDHTMWHYRDPIAIIDDILRLGFFNAAGLRAEEKILAPGDIIICNVAKGCVQVWVSDVSEAGVMVEPMASTKPIAVRGIKIMPDPDLDLE